MPNVVTTIDGLDDLLKDASDGVNAHLADISGQAQPVSRIYSTWDEPRRSRDTPYLVAMHTQVTPETTDGQGNRDWRHRFDFWYRSGGSDQEDTRKQAAWTAQATIRTLSPKRTQIADLIDGVRKVEVGGASVFWGRDVDQRTELLILRAELITREKL